MAIVKIRGLVETVFHDGKGVRVVERFTGKDSKEHVSRFTAWFDAAPDVGVGDQVNVSGFLTVKQGKEWRDKDGNKRQSIDVSVNKARIDSPEGTGAHLRAEQPTQAHGDPYDTAEGSGGGNGNTSTWATTDIPF